MRRAPAELRNLLPLTLLTIGLGGCTTASLVDILASGAGIYGGGNQTSGEIRQIDTRRREIQLESGWGGGQRIRYDGRTEVIYRQRRYDVRDLERGDHVRVWFDNNRNSRYASTIEVQESVRDRGGSGGNRVERFDGRIAEIDTRRGWFEMEQGNRGRLLVTLPYDASRTLDDRFRRLRRGDRVRIEGRLVGGGRVELMRIL